MAKSNRFRLKELIPLIVIIAIILTIGITLISYKLTPEQTISKYNTEPYKVLPTLPLYSSQLTAKLATITIDL